MPDSREQALFAGLSLGDDDVGGSNAVASVLREGESGTDLFQVLGVTIVGQEPLDGGGFGAMARSDRPLQIDGLSTACASAKESWQREEGATNVRRTVVGSGGGTGAKEKRRERRETRHGGETTREVLFRVLRRQDAMSSGSGVANKEIEEDV